MRSGPMQKLKSEPTSQARGTTRNSLQQATAKPALAPERDTRSRRLKAPTLSTAVKRKNDTGKPERESIERKEISIEELSHE